MKKLIIFDTTLRDGEQSPGASMNMAEKIQIARQLDNMGVDVIEAGFPVASDGDFESVRQIAGEMKNAAVCGLARAARKDIEKCWQALRDARKPRIHTFIATSPIHRKAKLNMSKAQIIDKIKESVSYARSLCDDVEFSAEDASRTEVEFLKEACLTAISAGAKTINIPDTVGYALPFEFGLLIAQLREAFKEKVVISVHCHDDLGMASANSVAALKNGASQVECTVNGIGERAGNAAMEEIVMSVYTRRDALNFKLALDTTKIYPVSSLVSRLCGISIQKNKAVVGENAFRHEAGIHQHGVLQDKLTYEIMTPESIGRKEESLVLGKHSGRHAIKERLNALAVDTEKIDMDDIFMRFKKVADKKKEVYDDELLALLEDQIGTVKKYYEIDYLHVISGTKTLPTATVKLKMTEDSGKEKIVREAACGDGPVDACYKAINKIVNMSPILVEYRIKAVSRGEDALGEVVVTIKEDESGHEIRGRGASTDIIEASAFAYIRALNRLNLLKESPAGVLKAKL